MKPLSLARLGMAELVSSKPCSERDIHLKKAVHLTMVTAGGLERNAHSGRVQSVVTLDDLFREG